VTDWLTWSNACGIYVHHIFQRSNNWFNWKLVPENPDEIFSVSGEHANRVITAGGEMSLFPLPAQLF
jgi:hypothetical protein